MSRKILTDGIDYHKTNNAIQSDTISCVHYNQLHLGLKRGTVIQGTGLVYPELQGVNKMRDLATKNYIDT